MNGQSTNYSFFFTNPPVFNRIRALDTEIADNPAASPAEAKFVLITKLQVKEMENMKTSFRNQVRNVVALDQFIRKRLKGAGSGLGGAEPALIGINFGEELSFRLPGSDEAFKIFTATLQRKSYFLHYQSRPEPEKKILKVNLEVADLNSWEQELTIILENISPTDYVITLLQKQYRNIIPKQRLVR